MIKGEVGKATTIWGAIVRSQYCYRNISTIIIGSLEGNIEEHIGECAMIRWDLLLSYMAFMLIPQTETLHPIQKVQLFNLLFSIYIHK